MRLLWMLVLFFSFFARTAVAGVDFSESTVTSDQANVPAGSVVLVQVVLKNSGSTAADGTNVRVRFPLHGFLVRIDELPQLTRDDLEREVTAVVDIPAGGEYRFSFDLLASRKEARRTLSAELEVRNFLAEARLDTEFSIKISSAPSTAGVVIGGLRFHPAAFWLLGWIGLGGVLCVGVPARMKWVREHPQSHKLALGVSKWPPLGLVAVIMVSLAFFMVGAGLLWRDWQTLTSWKEAPALILDRREIVATESKRVEGHRRKKVSTTRTPELALKYQAGEREIVSSGFDAGITFHIGEQVLGKAAMDDWVAGQTIPCWYDPADPANVVVRRGFGGGGIFVLVSLPILWFGLGQLRKISHAVTQLNQLGSGFDG